MSKWLDIGGAVFLRHQVVALMDRGSTTGSIAMLDDGRQYMGTRPFEETRDDLMGRGWWSRMRARRRISAARRRLKNEGGIENAAAWLTAAGFQ